VLNQYQKIIMEREKAFEAESASAPPPQFAVDEVWAPLDYSYRHGDGSAEISGAVLCDAANDPLHLIESGEPVKLRVVVRFLRDVHEPVIGFLIRNRHGIHAYGTNTKEQQIDFGEVRRGEIVEVTFTFACWLGRDEYSVSLAVHSRDGEAYDWLDAALFFRVSSMTLTEGVANLNANITTARRSGNVAEGPSENSGETSRQESVSYG
jgi:Wzt C-terminal domain